MLVCLCEGVLAKQAGSKKICLMLLPLLRYQLQVSLLLFSRASCNKLGLLPLTGLCSGSGGGGTLAAPIHATALAAEMGSDWFSKLKGCAWGFGWVCSNNGLSRQGEDFQPWYSLWLTVRAGALLCALREDCETSWQIQISSFSSQRSWQGSSVTRKDAFI